MRTKAEMRFALDALVAAVMEHVPDLGPRRWDLQVSNFGAVLTSTAPPRVVILPGGMAMHGPIVALSIEEDRSELIPPETEGTYQMLKSCLRSIDAILDAARKYQVPMSCLLDRQWTVTERGSMRYTPAAIPELIKPVSEMQMRTC